LIKNQFYQKSQRSPVVKGYKSIIQIITNKIYFSKGKLPIKKGGEKFPTFFLLNKNAERKSA
jgi:hypothetical protein